jgi:type I restriction enzyme S subunit
VKVEWVPLGAVLNLTQDAVTVEADGSYPSAGVLNRGRGLFDKGILMGSETSYSRLFRLSAGQVVYSKLFGWEGAVALVPEAFDGYFVSSEFPAFTFNSERLDPSFLNHYLKSSMFTDDMARSTNGLGQRRQRVNVDAFIQIRIPLPGVAAQKQVARFLDRLPAPRTPTESLAAMLDRLVSRSTIAAAEVRLGALLALQRRAVSVEPEAVYQEIGVRSFGRGLFIKEPLTGADLGGKRVFRVAEGDFIVSNVFGWEGAIGVASSDHNGLIGSHRFMTWTPKADLNVQYLRAYFRSQVGVARLAAASPGSAGRNRTLSVRNFEAIEVPLPDRAEQDRVAAAMAAIDNVGRVAARAERLSAAILPAARNEIFNSMR